MYPLKTTTARIQICWAVGAFKEDVAHGCCCKGETLMDQQAACFHHNRDGQSQAIEIALYPAEKGAKRVSLP